MESEDNIRRNNYFHKWHNYALFLDRSIDRSIAADKKMFKIRPYSTNKGKHLSLRLFRWPSAFSFVRYFTSPSWPFVPPPRPSLDRGIRCYLVVAGHFWKFLKSEVIACFPIPSCASASYFADYSQESWIIVSLESSVGLGWVTTTTTTSFETTVPCRSKRKTHNEIVLRRSMLALFLQDSLWPSNSVFMVVQFSSVPPGLLLERNITEDARSDGLYMLVMFCFILNRYYCFSSFQTSLRIN